MVDRLISPALRHYRQRFLPAMAAYACLLVAAVWIFTHRHPTGVLAYLLALLPAVPLAATIVIVGLYLKEEHDEFQRTVLIESMLWAIGATLSLTTIWGFLENFANAPHFQPYLVYPLFWFFVGVATPLLKLRYR